MEKRTIATGIVATLVLTACIGFGTTAYGTPLRQDAKVLF